MILAACPEWLNHIWAKSADRGEGGQPETLAQHTWYVLKRLSEFIQLRSSLPDELGVPRLWHILFWSAYIHDFGKAAAGFQGRLRGGPRWPHRHEVLSLAFVEWIADGFTAEELTWVVAAVVSHHKNASQIRRLYSPPDEFEDDQLIPLLAELSDDTIAGLWRWVDECAINWIKALELESLGVSSITLMSKDEAVSHVKYLGVDRVNHWLKIFRRFVTKLDKQNDVATIIGTLTLRGYLMNADHSASSHLGELPSVHIDQNTILISRNLTWDQLYDHQRKSGKITGSMLLTAPTGSGKTEAALLWAANQLVDRQQTPRLFYTLPYQASMNAMKLRLDESFGKDNVGLQHGRALLAQYRMEIEDDNDDADPKRLAERVRQARNMADLNYPPVRIFSPYQMLKGPYQLTGYEKLLSDYHHALFIFDEIHAYEVKRLALILNTIRYLRQCFKSRFMIMSATFPTLIKSWLREVLDDPIEVTADLDLFKQFQRHKLRLIDGDLQDDVNLQRILDEASTGKSVLVVCNLVDRAQAVFSHLREALSDTSVEVELLHGRFNGRDRLKKEKLVRDHAGRDETKRRPIILVATQVVEVSLDIDLDTIFSDPAPLEALVQRFGRINRRRLNKDLADVYIFTEPSDGQKIYEAILVKRTLSILKRENGKPVNEGEIGNWLDEIYADEVAEKWEAEYRQESANFDKACLRSLRAFESNSDLTKLFYKAFDGTEVLPLAFLNEYQALKKAEPIRATELLVPISYNRLGQLRGLNRVMSAPDEYPTVIDVPYDDQLGLDFSNINRQTFGIGTV